MEAITLETLPTWLVGIIMLYTGFIWLATRETAIRMDSRIIAWTELVWGTIYVMSLLATGGENTVEELVTRVFMTRLILVLMCLSQSIPLTISYVRGIKEGRWKATK